MTTDVSAEVSTLPEAVVETPLPDAENLETQASEGAEQPAEQANETELPVTPPAPRNPYELQAAVDAGEALTTAEKTALREYERAEANRQRDYQQMVQARAQRAQQLQVLKTQTPAAVARKVNELVENGEGHERLIAVEVNEILSGFMGESAAILYADLDNAIDGEVYTRVLQERGDAQIALNALQYVRDNAKDTGQRIQAYGEVRENLGRMKAVGGPELETLRSANTKLEATNKTLAARVEELSKVTGSPTTQGKASGADNGVNSLAEAEQMHSGSHPSGKTFTNSEMRAWRVSHGYSPI